MRRQIAIGTVLHARDRCGTWLDAKVVSERGEGSGREVCVHFNGWNRRHDEWLPIGDRLRIPGQAARPAPGEHAFDWDNDAGHVEDVWRGDPRKGLGW